MFSKLVAIPFLLAAVSNAQAGGEDINFVTVHFKDRAELQALGSQFQHMIVDRKLRTARVEVDAETLQALREVGFRVEIDAAMTERLRSLQRGLTSPGGAKSIPNFACYRTVEETYARMDELAQQKPNLAKVIDLGPSWEKSRDSTRGYTMKVLRLGNTANDTALPDKANMVVLSSIHAREYTPAETMTRFGEWLVNGYGSDAEATWLMDHFRFHLVLQANPDGRKKAEAGQSWRKNTNNGNGCSNSNYGTDLNRNFPFHWNTAAGGSSGDPCVETYRGPSRVSEPETQNLVRYVAGTAGSGGVYSGGVFPDRRGDAVSEAAPDDYRGIFMDIHSYSKLVMWPWGDTSTVPPNGAALRTFGRRMAWFNDYKPQQSVGLYATDGTTVDTTYGLLGVPSYIFELGDAFFESCSSFESTILPKNLAALRYSARNLHAPYKLPLGPDTTAVGVSSSSVVAGASLTLTATVDDSRFNQSNGSEPSQAIKSAAAWLDKAPWQEGATPIALTATDGSFSSASENVQGSISTSGLSAGVHTLFVQGTDADNKAGTPNAVRFTVTTGGDGTPTASFTSTASGLKVDFNGSASSDPDGSIVSYAWDFGDSSAAGSGATPSHTYAAAGTYTVRLTVTDNANPPKTASTSKQVRAGDLVDETVLQNGVAKTGLGAAKDGSLKYTLAVPSGATSLKFVSASGSGDADLYVKFGSAPTTSSYDCKSDGSTSAETCSIPTAQAGTYHVLLFGYSAFSGVSLTGSYSPGGGGEPSLFQNTNNVTISDNATVESSIAVNGRSGNASATLKVAVDIKHTYIGDLKVDLVAPDGSVYALHNRSGGNADNINTTYTVNASSELANGTWKLRVNDNYSNDVGYIDSWSLQF